MLRRKLLTRIGLLIIAFMTGAVVAIYLLQGTLAQIDKTNQDAVVLIGGVQSVGGAIASIQAARERHETGANIDSVTDGMTRAMKDIGMHDATRDPQSPAGAAYARLREALEEFAPAGDRSAAPQAHQALAPGVAAQTAVQSLSEALRTYVAMEQTNLGRSFRALVLGLTLAALVMVNVAIVVLLRTAQVVLKPVAALVEGSRELAAERFSHRVVVDQEDEFQELAHAYNRLAGQLEANEERKAEALRHLAVTLNHDLNNAMAVIELQLGLLDRRTGSNPTLGLHLNEIRSHLSQMSDTVASLKHIRRVVLTEYVPGQAMLDLPRSVEPPPPSEHAA